MNDLSGDIDAAVERASTGETTPADPEPAAPSGSAPPPEPSAASAGSAPAPSSRALPSNRPSKQAAAPKEPVQVSGEPPREKWDEILKNQREKTAKETRDAARAEFLAQYGIAPDVDAATLKSHLEILTGQGGFKGYYEAIKPILQSQGILPIDRPAPAPAARVDDRPQPDLRAEDGTAAYSAGAMERLLAWRDGQLMQRLTGQLAPLNQMREQVEGAQIRQRATEEARADIAEASQWDDFEALRPRMHAILSADGRATLKSAYIRAYQETNAARREALVGKTRQEVLDEIAKAPASRQTRTTVRPGQASPTAPGRTRRQSLDDRLEEAVTRAMAVQAT